MSFHKIVPLKPAHKKAPAAPAKKCDPKKHAKKHPRRPIGG
ncbi:hypothetical protein [Actinacidiphila oryziradicis]|jgi:hypothetical protein|nr:hypothetical protein [Actinacidiphila oryziradicis]MCW2874785.1 hypothetical protein [Actinacidiphila oryziradicis]